MALLSSAVFNWNQRRIERKRLRRVLAIEMSQLDLTNHLNLYMRPPDYDISPSDYSHPQYDANAENLKLLSQFEIERIVRFYNIIDTNRRDVRKNGSLEQNIYGPKRSARLVYQGVEPYLTGGISLRWKHRQRRRWDHWIDRYEQWRSTRAEE